MNDRSDFHKCFSDWGGKSSMKTTRPTLQRVWETENPALKNDKEHCAKDRLALRPQLSCFCYLAKPKDFTFPFFDVPCSHVHFLNSHQEVHSLLKHKADQQTWLNFNSSATHFCVLVSEQGANPTHPDKSKLFKTFQNLWRRNKSCHCQVIMFISSFIPSYAVLSGEGPTAQSFIHSTICAHSRTAWPD